MNSSALLDVANKEYGIGFNRLKRIIGQYVIDLFQTNSILAGLRNELNHSKEKQEVENLR